MEPELIEGPPVITDLAQAAELAQALRQAIERADGGGEPYAAFQNYNGGGP